VRSLLFVPANDAHRRGRAWTSGADAVILDLEDGVAPAAKDGARAGLAAALAQRTPGPRAVVRINAIDTAEGERDLHALDGLGVDAVVVPKADPGTIAGAAALGVPVIALVESATGVLQAEAIAREPCVTRLMFGPIDLAAELGAEPGPDGDELLFARSRLVLASAAAGLEGPIDGPHLDIHDPDQLRAETHRARRLGFTGKVAIHPGQLATIAEVLAPSAADVAWARAVAGAYEAGIAEGAGVVALDGRMIDIPVARRAYAILQRSGGRP
jgi:citrate lyase subunit beta/citryl-CoA lyase